MRTMNYVKKLTALTAAFLMVLSFLAACGERRPDGIHETQVIRQLSVQEYGPYVFYSRGAVIRYNRTTNEVSRPGDDPECDGAELLNGTVTELNQIYEGKLIFSCFTAFSHDFRYVSYDVVSGKTKVIASLGEAETAASHTAAVFDGYLYYARKLLKEGGDRTKLSDYETYFCRTSLSGGSEERILRADGAALFAVTPGRLVTIKDGKLLSADLNTKEETILMDFDEYGFSGPAGKSSALGNSVFFLCKGVNNDQVIVRADAAAGTAEVIVNEPVFSFCLTDGGIFYLPKVTRDGKMKDDNGEEITVPAEVPGNELRFCEIGGSGCRVAAKLGQVNARGDFTVIDGKLIGLLGAYDPEDALSVTAFFGTIDLKTGQYSMAFSPDAADAVTAR